MLVLKKKKKNRCSLNWEYWVYLVLVQTWKTPHPKTKSSSCLVWTKRDVHPPVVLQVPHSHSKYSRKSCRIIVRVMAPESSPNSTRLCRLGLGLPANVCVVWALRLHQFNWDPVITQKWPTLPQAPSLSFSLPLSPPLFLSLWDSFH